MKFIEGREYSGFILLKNEFVSEIQSECFIFEHNITKAKLLAIKNNDNNKTFAINFKTVVEDSTGVPHILEHSVLAGSKKYPLKDVFSEVMKGGLNTFLNAFTSLDATMYPFSTRNEKEYFDIMDIYLDAVLNPVLSRNTFLREGWYYDISTKDEPLKLNGIVYNEMKGAFSDPHEILRNGLFKTIMPDSSYIYNTGGDPREIPDLTYEKFVDFHKRHYHPSNSIAYVYGDADLLKELSFIDDFFRPFGPGNSKIIIKTGKPLERPAFFNDTYSIDENTKTDEKTFIDITTLVSDSRDIGKNLAFSVLSNILHSSNASPLKKAIVNAKICNDFSGFFLTYLYHTLFSNFLTGTEKKHMETFKDIYFDTLNMVVDKGFDKDLVLSILNRYEFSLRKTNCSSMRGFSYGYRLLKAYTHGAENLLEELKLTPHLERLRKEAVDNRLLEGLVNDYLINNPKTVISLLEPDPAKSSRINKDIAERLSKIKQDMKEEDIEYYINQAKELKAESNKNSTEEEIRLIPKLKIEDIDKDIPFHEVTIENIDDIPLLVSDIYTNKIIYLEIGFKVDALELEELHLLNLFGELLMELGTPNISYERLSILKAELTGDLSTYFKPYSDFKDRNNVKKYFWVKLSSTEVYMEKALKLLADILLNTNFEDDSKIKDIIDRIFIRTQQDILSEGDYIPESRLLACLCERGRYAEAVGGYSSFEYLKNLRQNYDNEKGPLREKLLKIKEKLFSRNNLIIQVTSSNGLIKEFKENANLIIDSLNNSKFKEKKIKWNDIHPNEAFLTPAEVVFAYTGTNLYNTGLKYSGSVEVLKKYIGRDYLYKHIRLIGGAYGSRISINSMTGNMLLGSYRDPNVRKTYEAFYNIPNDIEKFDISKDMFFQFIIGAYSSFDPLLNPDSRAVLAKNEYLSGVTAEFKRNTVKELLSTTPDDIRAFAPFLRQALNNGFRSIIGSSSKISADKDLFNRFITV